MKYNQGILETVIRTVPVGNVVADTAYIIGAECLVAVEDGTAGATDGVFVKRGCCGLTFKAGDKPADGAACYLNNTTHEVEGTASATNYLIGCRNSNLETGLPATRIMVDLDGTAASVYGVPGDIQGVTAGTGLTGGGTTGTVTLAVDTTVHPTMPAVGGAGNLVQTAGANRVLSDSGIVAANVPQMAAASAGAKKVVRAAGADKTLVADGPDYDLLPTMAAAAAAPGTLIQSAGADRTQSDSGIVATNVPQMPAVGGVDELLYTPAADRSVAPSGIRRNKVMRLDLFTEVEVTIALGATSGSSAADPALVGGKLIVCYPKSGNDQPVVSYVLNGDGSVTVTVAAAESAEAKFQVMVYASV